jgi:hypothetical protein
MPGPEIPKARPFLTIVPGRTPKSKVHTSLGIAKTALVQAPKVLTGYDRGKYLHESIDGILTGRRKYVTTVCGGEIWELVDGEWQMLFDVPSDTFTHDVPWRRAEYEFYVDDQPDAKA